MVYTWNGHDSEGDSVHALLAYVESDGERLRAKYLAWIHDLGETRIDDKRLIDHLVVEDGLSAWWMTLFVDQSPWLSPSIMDVLRLFAIEEIVAARPPAALRLVSANAALSEVLADWCQRRYMTYEWRRAAKTRSAPTLRRAYRALPNVVTAIIDLIRFLRSRWPLRTPGNAPWFAGPDSVFLCSTFFNLDAEQARTGRFHSRYWEGLHALLRQMGLHPNWLHLYQPHEAVPSPGVAMDWVHRFNDRRADEGFHAFLESYLSWTVVRRSLSRWLEVAVRASRLRGIEEAFRRADSQMSLWPLVRGDWRASTRGSVALFNNIFIQLFDKALADAPTQPQGLYLFENQAWERALIHAWRKHGHGRLVGVAHSTVRFWDLRYFTDPRTVRASDPLALPRPDLVALNGDLALEAYRGFDFPSDSVIACEALRYGYLNDRPTVRPAERTSGELRVLILGDYMPAGTGRMMELLVAARTQLDVPATFTIKAHPRCPVDSSDYPGLNLEIVDTALGQILPEFDVAYSSNMTAAAIDAYLAGLPVVVMLDEEELNFSPLRGVADVRFVTRPGELAMALRSASDAGIRSPDRGRFLFLDPALPRWRELLASGRSASADASTLGTLLRTN